MQRSEDIHREFQPSSFVVLSCRILVHVCERVLVENARVFYEGISYHHSLLSSRVHSRKNAIMGYDNRAHS